MFGSLPAEFPRVLSRLRHDRTSEVDPVGAAGATVVYYLAGSAGGIVVVVLLVPVARGPLGTAPAPDLDQRVDPQAEVQRPDVSKGRDRDIVGAIGILSSTAMPSPRSITSIPSPESLKPG